MARRKQPEPAYTHRSYWDWVYTMIEDYNEGEGE